MSLLAKFDLRHQPTKRLDHLIFNFQGQSKQVFDALWLLINEYADVRVTPLRLDCKYILTNGTVAFVSPDGHVVYFSRGGTNAIQALNDHLSGSGVVVGCRKMLAHAVKMESQLGQRDVVDLNKEGFTFDSCSRLWITHPKEMLRHISSPKDAKDLCEDLHKKVTDKFERFADLYLRQTFYIMAFWPLDEESVAWANAPDSSVRKWIKLLNRWVKNKKNDGIKRPIDRVFVVPEKWACFSEGGYELKDNTGDYKKMLINFFKDIFQIDRCEYRGNVKVIFNMKAVRNALFETNTSNLLRENGQNAILFSKKRFEKLNNFVGVLQFEDTYELPKVSEHKVMNLRYLTLNPARFGQSNTSDQFVEELKAIRKELGKPRKQIIEGVERPIMINVNDFLRDTLNIG